MELRAEMLAHTLPVLFHIFVLFNCALNTSAISQDTETKMSLSDFAAASTTKSPTAPLRRRGKRYLDFIPETRMFYRVNCKNNIIPKPTIWAHGYGFRVNIPIENDRRVRPFRRDTYTMMHDLMEKIGFDGKMCVLKAFCVAHAEQRPMERQQGVLFKLLKHVFTLEEHERHHFPYLRMENCEQILHSHCPLSFDNISPYTDDV